jgi:hypothetical protein
MSMEMGLIYRLVLIKLRMIIRSPTLMRLLEWNIGKWGGRLSVMIRRVAWHRIWRRDIMLWERME